MDRILLVSPYPPQPDGIGAYAIQTVRRLRSEGHHVEVLSPGPSAAHHHLDLLGPRGALALAKRTRHYDKVIVQFHPGFFYAPPFTPNSIAAESLALAMAFRLARDLEVRVHEIDYSWGAGNGRAARVTRQLWRSVDRIVVHTDAEKREFVEAFRVSPDTVEVTAHGTDFVHYTTATKAEARASLGIGPTDFSFLSIGFIQSHKGFDRAVRVFAQLEAEHKRLDIVGGVRVEDREQMAYSEELQRLVDEASSAHLHLGFLSDEAFDRWIVAADVVVLPYRHIWSSGVLERARLYGAPVIATAVGGLAEQAGDRPGLTIVEDDDALRAAMASALGLHDRVSEQWSLGSSDRADVQAEIERRALISRGTPMAADDTTVPAWTVQKDADPPSAPLRRLGSFVRPALQRGRPGAKFVRRVVRRLVNAEIDPLVEHINELQHSTIESVDRLPSADRGRGSPRE